MPCWFYEKHELQNSPSIQEGITEAEERAFRVDGARFIMRAGFNLGLSSETSATGVVYFHRFYMKHSFQNYPRYVTAACCLFLAGKVEETPKKCKDIVRMCKENLTELEFQEFGSDPREEVMTIERILLFTIKFDLQIMHPYKCLFKLAKKLKDENKENINNLVQTSWTFINDSLCTTLSIQWEPEIIAVALIYLASRLRGYQITDWEGKTEGYQGKWWEFMHPDLSKKILEEICHQVLDLYQKKGGTDMLMSGNMGKSEIPRKRPATPTKSSPSKKKPFTPPSTSVTPEKSSQSNKSSNPETLVSSSISLNSTDPSRMKKEHLRLIQTHQERSSTNKSKSTVSNSTSVPSGKSQSKPNNPNHATSSSHVKNNSPNFSIQNPPTNISVPNQPPPNNSVQNNQPPKMSVPNHPPPNISVPNHPPPNISVPNHPPPNISVPNHPPPNISVPNHPPPNISVPNHPPPNISGPNHPPHNISHQNHPPPNMSIPNHPPPIISGLNHPPPNISGQNHPPPNVSIPNHPPPINLQNHPPPINLQNHPPPIPLQNSAPPNLNQAPTKNSGQNHLTPMRTPSNHMLPNQSPAFQTQNQSSIPIIPSPIRQSNSSNYNTNSPQRIGGHYTDNSNNSNNAMDGHCNQMSPTKLATGYRGQSPYRPSNQFATNSPYTPRSQSFMQPGYNSPRFTSHQSSNSAPPPPGMMRSGNSNPHRTGSIPPPNFNNNYNY